MLKHRSIWTWLSLSAIVAVLGGGLFAATTDALLSQGNDVQSNAIAEGAGVDVQGAIVSDASLCNAGLGEGAFSDGPIGPVVTGTFDLNAQAPTITSEIVCLRNIGDTDASVIARHTDAVQTEVGTCEQSEIDAGDVSCGDGDVGELRANFGPETSTQCAIDPSTFRFVIPVGGYCDYQYDAVAEAFDAVNLNPLPFEQAQTDRVQYSLEWDATEIAPTPTCDDAGAEQDTGADPLTVGSPVSTTACDDDWYVIADGTYTPGAAHTADLTFLHADADFDLEVFDGVGTPLGSASSTDDNETVPFTAPASGPIHVRVVYFNGPGPDAPYSLVVNESI